MHTMSNGGLSRDPSFSGSPPASLSAAPSQSSSVTSAASSSAGAVAKGAEEVKTAPSSPVLAPVKAPSIQPEAKESEPSTAQSAAEAKAEPQAAASKDEDSLPEKIPTLSADYSLVVRVPPPLTAPSRESSDVIASPVAAEPLAGPKKESRGFRAEKVKRMLSTRTAAKHVPSPRNAAPVAAAASPKAVAPAAATASSAAAPAAAPIAAVESKSVVSAKPPAPSSRATVSSKPAAPAAFASAESSESEIDSDSEAPLISVRTPSVTLPQKEERPEFGSPRASLAKEYSDDDEERKDEFAAKRSDSEEDEEEDSLPPISTQLNRQGTMSDAANREAHALRAQQAELDSLSICSVGETPALEAAEREAAAAAKAAAEEAEARKRAEAEADSDALPSAAPGQGGDNDDLSEAEIAAAVAAARAAKKGLKTPSPAPGPEKGRLKPSSAETRRLSNSSAEQPRRGSLKQNQSSGGDASPGGEKTPPPQRPPELYRDKTVAFVDAPDVEASVDRLPAAARRPTLNSQMSVATGAEGGVPTTNRAMSIGIGYEPSQDDVEDDEESEANKKDVVQTIGMTPEQRAVWEQQQIALQAGALQQAQLNLAMQQANLSAQQNALRVAQAQRAGVVMQPPVQQSAFAQPFQQPRPVFAAPPGVGLFAAPVQNFAFGQPSAFGARPYQPVAQPAFTSVFGGGQPQALAGFGGFAAPQQPYAAPAAGGFSAAWGNAAGQQSVFAPAQPFGSAFGAQPQQQQMHPGFNAPLQWQQQQQQQAAFAESQAGLPAFDLTLRGEEDLDDD